MKNPCLADGHLVPITKKTGEEIQIGDIVGVIKYSLLGCKTYMKCVDVIFLFPSEIRKSIKKRVNDEGEGQNDIPLG